LSIAGTATLTAGAGNNITLDNNNDFATLAISSGNTLTVNDVNGIDFGASTISGNMVLTAAGAVTDSGAMTVSGTTSLTAGAANNITFDSANDFGGSVTIVSGNNVLLTDTGALDLAASTVSGTLTLNTGGSITDSGTLTVAGTTTLNAGTSDITFDEASSTFGTLQLTGRDVAVFENADMDFGTSSVSRILDVQTTGAITQSGAITAAHFRMNAAGQITLDTQNNSIDVLGTVTRGGNFKLKDAVGNLTISGPVGAGGDVTIEAVNGDIELSGTVSGGLVILAAGANFINNVGAGAIPATRFLIYSTDPSLNLRNGLLFGFEEFNVAFPKAPTISTGNGFLYKGIASGRDDVLSKIVENFVAVSDRYTDPVVTGAAPNLIGTDDSAVISLAGLNPRAEEFRFELTYPELPEELHKTTLASGEDSGMIRLRTTPPAIRDLNL
jgi:hypothetical protein